MVAKRKTTARLATEFWGRAPLIAKEFYSRSRAFVPAGELRELVVEYPLSKQ